MILWRGDCQIQNETGESNALSVLMLLPSRTLLSAHVAFLYTFHAITDVQNQ